MKNYIITILTILCVILCCFLICACNSENQYEIKFIVDDEVFATSKFVDNKKINMPQNPTKEGYVFQEWRFDDGKTLNYQTLSEVPLTQNTEITVYAFFVKYDCSMDNLQHTFEVEITPSTCETSGKECKHCTVCKTYIETIIPQLGHSLGDLIIDKQATCESIGLGHKHCSRCGNDFEQTIKALGHTLSDLIIDEQATCLNSGAGHKHCNSCGKDFAQTLPNLGHNFNSSRQCMRCGTVRQDVTVNSLFGSRTFTVDFELDKKFTIDLISYNIDKLLFVGYYVGNQQITDEDGVSLALFDGNVKNELVAHYVYEISKPEDFLNIQKNSELSKLTSQKGQFLNVTVELKNDIDFSAINDWTPISTGGLIFDGKGHKIINFTSTQGGLFNDVGNLGKNGEINDYTWLSVIENIRFENLNINITDTSKVVSDISAIGGLASQVLGSVKNIFMDSGEIVANYNKGIRIASVAGMCLSIQSCENHIDITSNWCVVGGIACWVGKYERSSSDAFVINCKNYGTLIAGNRGIGTPYGNGYVSGIVAVSAGISKIEQCTNYGNITAQGEANAILACVDFDYGNPEIINCNNFGEITEYAEQ